MKTSADSHPLCVSLDISAKQISGLTKELGMEFCLSISYQLIMDFLGSVAYQVKVSPTNELRNNLSS